ncbi:skin secretory protein xP2-like [Ovis canadensis]|uniref:skin secretory protein xP2-like n=1 Tax=Ovis canadensis TaxID=37174 RepID=UPI00375032F4
MLKCPEMFNSTLFQRRWLNLPAVPQGKHTERPRGQRGKPPGGISRLCKTDGREERGQRSGLGTGSSPDAAAPPAAPHPGLGASSSRPAAARSPHSPQRPGSATRPRGADRAPGGAEGGAQGARAPLQQAARRGLGTEGDSSPRARAAQPQTRAPPPARRPPLHSAAPKALVSAATRIRIPEEAVPRRLVAPAQGETEERAAAPAPPQSPPPSPFPAEPDGKGPARPGAPPTPRGRAPGGCGGGRGRPQVPQVNGASEAPQRGLGAPASSRDGRARAHHGRRRRAAHARPSAPSLSPA